MPNDSEQNTFSPSTEKVLGLVTRAASDAKGKDLTVLDVADVFSLAKYFVIVSGRSDRQVQGISNRIVDSLAAVGVEPVSIEGVEQGHWALLDLGDILVHVFFEETREQFDLESLWARARRIHVSPDGEFCEDLTHEALPTENTSGPLVLGTHEKSNRAGAQKAA